VKVLDRCVDESFEKGFKHFLDFNLVSAQYSPLLLPKLKELANFELLLLFVKKVQDISPLDIIKLLQFAMAHSEAHKEDAQRALELM
jgi:hypothetical protein